MLFIAFYLLEKVEFYLYHPVTPCHPSGGGELAESAQKGCDMMNNAEFCRNVRISARGAALMSLS